MDIIIRLTDEHGNYKDLDDLDYSLIVQINDSKWRLPRHFRCFRTRLARSPARPDFSDEITILKSMRDPMLNSHPELFLQRN